MWSAARLSLALLGIAFPTGDALAQAKRGPLECPWCKEDPAKLAEAGILSHGPFPIAAKTSEALARELPGTWLFLETPHLRWASTLGEENVEIDEQERVRAELARLRKILPSVPEKVRKLDPWLRLHLIAMKGEDVYARMQQILRVKDEDFPAQRSAKGPFMGAGKFLGERDKFEVVLHRTVSAHNAFTREFSGAQVTGALRWHFKTECKMHASIPCEDSDLRRDRWLMPHVAHNLSHLFFSAYKHFSYDPPMWLDEGLALCIEKEVEPLSTTNEGEEGTYRDARGPKDWYDAARKMLARGRQKPVAQLFQITQVGEMDTDALVTSWSIVRFLIDEHGEPFAKFLGGVKGQLDASGVPVGSDLPGLQRKLLKEHFEWTPIALEEVWKGWAAKPAATAK